MQGVSVCLESCHPGDWHCDTASLMREVEDLGGRVEQRPRDGLTHFIIPRSNTASGETANLSFRARTARQKGASLVVEDWLVASVRAQRPLGVSAYSVTGGVQQLTAAAGNGDLDGSQLGNVGFPLVTQQNMSHLHEKQHVRSVSAWKELQLNDQTTELNGDELRAAMHQSRVSTGGVTEPAVNAASSLSTKPKQTSMLAFFGQKGKATGNVAQSNGSHKRLATASANESSAHKRVRNFLPATSSHSSHQIGQWFWRNDADEWVAFPMPLCVQFDQMRLALAQSPSVDPSLSRVRVDDERFVDVDAMVQGRYDNPRKIRPIKVEDLTQPAISPPSRQEQSAQWSWRTDLGEWKRFAPNLNEILEHAFLQRQSRTIDAPVHVQIDTERFVDLKDLSQLVQRRYDDSAKIRAVKREVEHKNESAAVPMWCWSNSTGDRPLWVNYSAEESSAIEDAFARRRLSYRFNDGKVIHFNDMLEIRQNDERKRYVSRSGPRPRWIADDKVPGLNTSSSVVGSADAQTIPAHADEYLDVDISSQADSVDTVPAAQPLTQNNWFDLSPSQNDIIESDTDEDDGADDTYARRLRYKCGTAYIPVAQVPSWNSEQMGMPTEFIGLQKSPYGKDADINAKIALFQGDITTLECDGILNAAKPSLLGGGGIDGAIHLAAGPGLLRECQKLDGCEVGETVITSGHRLPARNVLHTVGPIGERPVALRRCYLSALKLAKKHNLRTIALCCVSTGIYGYPPEKAAHVALQTVREWLECSDENFRALDKVVFCMWTTAELDVYRCTMPRYFP